MTLTLFIVAVVGLFIFVIAYLRIIIASFRHHTVTGLISMIPGINLAVLPTVWAKINKAFPMSVLGLAITLGGWYMGGNLYLDKNQNSLFNKPKNTQTASPTQSSLVQKSKAMPTEHKTKEQPLPQKPLYYIRFKKIAISQLDSLLDQYIRIQLVDDREIEGKNIKSSSTELLIETYSNGSKQVVKVPSKHIRTLEKLVRSDK